MATFILVCVALFAGYFVGHSVGVAKTMLRVQGLLSEMQNIVKIWETHEEQWNEDKL